MAKTFWVAVWLIGGVISGGKFIFGGGVILGYEVILERGVVLD